MKKEEYTGRTYEELRKVKVSDMTGEELEFFQKKQKTTDKEPTIINNIFYGLKGMSKKTLDAASEKAAEMADTFKELANKERTESAINKIIDDKVKEQAAILREEFQKTLKPPKK